MRNTALTMGIVLLMTASPLVLRAQTEYPDEALEQYYECQERNDLVIIKDLLWYHKNVERIDATIYGLPRDDFDDTSQLTIDERIEVRLRKAEAGITLATSGPVQYPHHLRPAIDHWYEISGVRPDCSAILEATGAVPPLPEDIGSGWASDFNLTSTDSRDRGEVDIVIDYANPSRILASSCPSGGGVDSSSNFIAYTSDYGQTWGRVGVGNSPGSSWECDPASYYQRSTGAVYHSKIACNNGSCSGWTRAMMRKSSNNGQTWSDCGRLGTEDDEDRQWHVVDNTPSSTCYGNIYATWHSSNQEIVARSTNDCASWTNRTNLTNAYQAITPDINVAADGHVYAVWQNHGDATFKIRGSADCGVTWNSPGSTTVKTRLGDWKNEIPAQCQRGIPAQPSVDVDRCPSSAYYGRVYVAMFDFNTSGCGSGPGCSNWSSTCNYDIWLTYSDNQGSSWSTAVNISSGEGNQVDHFMGYMRVDEADGSIYIGYHRSRLNPASLSDRQKTHFFVRRSIDGGLTFEPAFQASSLEGDERLAGASGFERGDYNRVDVFEGVAWPVWVDRRNTSGEEEVVTRKLCSEPAHLSERAPSFTPPPVSATPIGSKIIQVSWTAPDIYWGDGGEDPSARKFQLWVDSALSEDDIPATTTSTNYTAADCTTAHTFQIRAVNQCDISKEYADTTVTATGCCDANPAVDVSPDGPLTRCTGTGQTLNAGVTGGTGPFDYQWTVDSTPIGGAIGSSHLVNDTGTHSYNCEVTGNGCTEPSEDPAAVTISWQSAPTFSGLESVVDPGNANCTLDLSWSLATSPCAGPITYDVHRSTSPGFIPDGTNRVATGVTTTSYSDSAALVNATTYYYIVRAVDQSTGGVDSNTVERSGAPTGPMTIGTWSDDAGDTGSAQLTLTAPWHVATSGGNNGPKVYYTDPYGNDLCAAVETPTLHLGSSAELSFWSKYDIEDDWDKGEVQISTNGGSSWTRVAVNYPGYASNTGDACDLPTGDYFSGLNLTYAEYTASLASWSDQDVQLRWVLSSDSYVTESGWWVDDITITNVEVAGSCSSDSTLFLDGFESGDTSVWSATAP